MSCARLAHLFLWRKGFVLAICGMGWGGCDGHCSLSVPWHLAQLWNGQCCLGCTQV